MECSFQQRVLREWNQSVCWDNDCTPWWKACCRQYNQIFLGTFLGYEIGILWGGLYPHGLSKSVNRLQSYVQQYVNEGGKRQRALLSLGLRSCSNRPFYSYVLSCLAFEWKWGWSWPCFDRNLTPFHMQISTN